MQLRSENVATQAVLEVRRQGHWELVENISLDASAPVVAGGARTPTPRVQARCAAGLNAGWGVACGWQGASTLRCEPAHTARLHAR